MATLRCARARCPYSPSRCPMRNRGGGPQGLLQRSRCLARAPVVNVLGLLGDKLQGVDVGGGAGHLHHVVEEVLGAVLDAVLLLQRGSAQVDETTVESGRAAANAGCLKDDDFGTGLARLDGGCRAGASNLPRRCRSLCPMSQNRQQRPCWRDRLSRQTGRRPQERPWLLRLLLQAPSL